MKAKRRIAWLLSFLMVFSLIMGTSKMQVFAAGGTGETATFEIRESNGQTGTVQYKLNGNGDFLPANNTPVELNGVTSITIKAIPAEDAKVNQNNSGITGTGQPATFDYNALTSESGWTYNIQDNDGNITFTIEFDNYDGTGGGENPGSYSVDFGTGSWIVGGVTVIADKSGKQTLSESDIITLTGFDAETMEARVDAEDGFGTTLVVTNGQTSISAHTSDGVGPTNIAFSVVAKSSGGGGGDNPQQQGPSIEFFADSSIEGGTLAINNGIFTLSKDGSGLGTFRVTLVDSANQETAYIGNEERILLDDISSVKIVMTPAEGMKANLITGGDTPAGALSEPVFNDEGNTYTYTAYPSQFGGEQQFLAVSVWFGESEDDLNQVDFTAVIWDGDQVENKSEHGSITVSSVVIGSTTYTYKGNGRFENNNTETDLIEWYGYNKTSINEEAGVRIMDAAFDDPNTEVYINFVFKPDYGYQVTGIGTNESTTSLASAGFSASETISTFRFRVIQHNNPHFAVAFTATEDIVKANAASISEGGVELATGELDGGSAVLEVNEANITNQGDFEAAAEGLVVSEYLDISLYNVFYKENADNVWSSPIENLSRPAEITLKLQEAIDTDTVKIVHEKGDGEIELLDADYDPETKEITFSTSSFSNYAIAYKKAPSHTHVGTKIDQVKETCAAYGVKEYYKCSCGKYFEDAACKKEITDLDAWKNGAGRIAKVDHVIETTTTKATTLKNGKMETKCSVCGKVTKTTDIYAAKRISLSTTSYTYDGKVKKPAVTIKDSKGKTIAASNYNVTYGSGRKNVGKYTVKITFKGNYEGKVTKSFKINPKSTTISSITPKSKGFTVKWKKKKTQTTGYQIQYSTSSTFKSAKTVTVSGNATTNKKISKLKAKKKYYVRIRTYKKVGSAKYYSSWSKAKKVTTKG